MVVPQGSPDASSLPDMAPLPILGRWAPRLVMQGDGTITTDTLGAAPHEGDGPESRPIPSVVVPRGEGSRTPGIGNPFEPVSRDFAAQVGTESTIQWDLDPARVNPRFEGREFVCHGFTNTVNQRLIPFDPESGMVISRSQEGMWRRSYRPTSPWDHNILPRRMDMCMWPVLAHSAAEQGHCMDWGRFCAVCRNSCCDRGLRDRDQRYPGGHSRSCLEEDCLGCTDDDPVGSDDDGMGGRIIDFGDGHADASEVHFDPAAYPPDSDGDGD